MLLLSVARLEHKENGRTLLEIQDENTPIAEWPADEWTRVAVMREQDAYDFDAAVGEVKDEIATCAEYVRNGGSHYCPDADELENWAQALAAALKGE